MNKKNLVASLVVLVWGAAILVNAVASGGADGDGAYGTGQALGLLFALVLVVLGGRGLAKELAKRTA